MSKRLRSARDPPAHLVLLRQAGINRRDTVVEPGEAPLGLAQFAKCRPDELRGAVLEPLELRVSAPTPAKVLSASDNTYYVKLCKSNRTGQIPSPRKFQSAPVAPIPYPPAASSEIHQPRTAFAIHRPTCELTRKYAWVPALAGSESLPS